MQRLGFPRTGLAFVMPLHPTPEKMIRSFLDRWHRLAEPLLDAPLDLLVQPGERRGVFGQLVNVDDVIEPLLHGNRDHVPCRGDALLRRSPGAIREPAFLVRLVQKSTSKEPPRLDRTLVGPLAER